MISVGYRVNSRRRGASGWRQLAVVAAVEETRHILDITLRWSSLCIATGGTPQACNHFR